MTSILGKLWIEYGKNDSNFFCYLKLIMWIMSCKWEQTNCQSRLKTAGGQIQDRGILGSVAGLVTPTHRKAKGQILLNFSCSKFENAKSEAKLDQCVSMQGNWHDWQPKEKTNVYPSSDPKHPLFTFSNSIISGICYGGVWQLDGKCIGSKVDTFKCATCGGTHLPTLP